MRFFWQRLRRQAHREDPCTSIGRVPATTNCQPPGGEAASRPAPVGRLPGVSRSRSCRDVRPTFGRTGGDCHRAVQAPGADRRRGLRHRLHGRPAGSGAPARGTQDHQAGHGYEGGARAVRGRATGPGADGPSEYRPGARCGGDRRGPALFRDGAGPRRADHGVLRPEQAARPRAARAVRAKSAAQCSTPIRRASSTATSSRRTCS